MLIYFFTNWLKNVSSSKTIRCKQILVISAPLWLLIFLPGCLSNSSEDWETFKSIEHEFTIDYPSNLLIINGSDNGIKNLEFARFKAYNNNARLSIVVEIQKVDNPTIEKATEWGMHYPPLNPIEKINSGFEEVSIENETLGDYEIVRRRYVYNNSGLMWEHIYMARENDLVIIRMRVNKSDFGEYSPIFNRMVNSFSALG